MQSGVVCRFEPQERGVEPFPLSQKNVVLETHVQPSVDLSGYLFHYVRSCPGPWPGQTIADYCRSLAEGSPESRHTAFDSLQRILSEGTTRGSNRLTRGPLPVVSFTERPPGELEAIIRWRPGLIRWSFEPYGIGVPKEILGKLGARPVIYGDEGALGRLNKDERLFFQFRKTDGADWSGEKEWRLIGDLDLGLISPERLLVLVPSVHEAQVIEARFGCRAITVEVHS